MMILPKQLNSFRWKIWWQNLHLISASNSVEYARKQSQWIFQMIIFSGQSILQLLELGQRVNKFSLKRSSILIQLLFKSPAVSQTSSSTGLRGERIKILWRSSISIWLLEIHLWWSCVVNDNTLRSVKSAVERGQKGSKEAKRPATSPPASQ